MNACTGSGFGSLRSCLFALPIQVRTYPTHAATRATYAYAFIPFVPYTGSLTIGRACTAFARFSMRMCTPLRHTFSARLHCPICQGSFRSGAFGLVFSVALNSCIAHVPSCAVPAYGLYVQALCAGRVVISHRARCCLKALFFGLCL